MGGKQHAIKLPMNHLRNQIENYKKAGDKWKLKHNKGMDTQTVVYPGNEIKFGNKKNE